MENRDLIRDAMMFAVKDITGRVLREATVQTMVDDFENLLNLKEQQVKSVDLADVVGQSEQLPEDEEETKCPDHTPYWGVCSTCGQY